MKRAPTARIIEYCVKKRLQWNSCFARKFYKESEYYDNLMRYLLKNLTVCALQNVRVDLRKLFYLVNFTLEEFKKLSNEETAIVDKVCKEEANSFVMFYPDIVRDLCRRGLVYFEVPLYPDDRLKGVTLFWFVLYMLI
ncbi:hypothetical protein P8452_61201 [Trifolium repens]|nr:hypothetical protein P8452_61201 [Trifolium repens]